MADAIQIDGSFGEGGGQIVRTSVSLAAMTGHSVEIHQVRGRRTKPGLQPQHLAAVRAAAALCQAQLSGDDVGSQFLRFEPQGPVVAGDYHFDIGTAGAAPLVVQTVLVPLAKAVGVSNVRVTGGTHVPHSPTVSISKPSTFHSYKGLVWTSSQDIVPLASIREVVEKSICKSAARAQSHPWICASGER